MPLVTLTAQDWTLPAPVKPGGRFSRKAATPSRGPGCGHARLSAAHSYRANSPNY
jgi:hypothetical protein